MLNVVFLSRDRGDFLFELAARLHVLIIIGTVLAFVTLQVVLAWTGLLFAAWKLIDDFIGLDHAEIPTGQRFNIFPVVH